MKIFPHPVPSKAQTLEKWSPECRFEPSQSLRERVLIQGLNSAYDGNRII